jgi:hypothetical protein
LLGSFALTVHFYTGLCWFVTTVTEFVPGFLLALSQLPVDRPPVTMGSQAWWGSTKLKVCGGFPRHSARESQRGSRHQGPTKKAAII